MELPSWIGPTLCEGDHKRNWSGGPHQPASGENITSRNRRMVQAFQSQYPTAGQQWAQSSPDSSSAPTVSLSAVLRHTCHATIFTHSDSHTYPDTYYTQLCQYLLHQITYPSHTHTRNCVPSKCQLYAENRTGQKNPDWLASISQAPTLSSVLKEMWGHKCMDCMVIGPDYQAGPRDKTNPHEMKTLHLLAIHSLT